jgi:hypothetical protein
VSTIASLAAVVAIAAGGCGGSSPRPLSHRSIAAAGGACTTRALVTLAAAVAIPARAIGNARFVAADASAACRFSAARAAGGPLAVTVLVNGDPQAYYRLERTAVEYGQTVLWYHRSTSALPLFVPGLGLVAYWFPADRKLMTTDGVHLISIFVTSAPRRAGGGETLATTLARRYLGP